MTRRFASLIITLFACAFPAQAQESGAAGAAPAAAEDPWSGKLALGYLATSGNTDSSSLNTAAEIGYVHGDWTHLLDATAIKADENNESTAEAYKVGWKSELSFSEHDFLFGRLTWRKDLFSGYDQQFSQTVGYGRRIIETPKHRLSLEIGGGARQSDLSDGTRESETILRGGGLYRWNITETSRFTQEISVESGETNTYAESITALRTRVLGDLALVASYTIKNNSDVPVGTEKTDTYTAISLEYAF